MGGVSGTVHDPNRERRLSGSWTSLLVTLAVLFCSVWAADLFCSYGRLIYFAPCVGSCFTFYSMWGDTLGHLLLLTASHTRPTYYYSHVCWHPRRTFVCRQFHCALRFQRVIPCENVQMVTYNDCIWNHLESYELRYGPESCELLPAGVLMLTDGVEGFNTVEPFYPYSKSLQTFLLRVWGCMTSYCHG